MSGGIGDRPPAVGLAQPSEASVQPPLPRAALAHIMSAPAAVSDSALDALEAAAVPVLTEELEAIYTVWPAVIADAFARIERPVQLVLSEHEPLWLVDAAASDRIAKLLSGPADALVVWPDVGHCIDYHTVAPAFQDAQLAFLETCRRQATPGQRRDADAFGLR